MAKEKIYLDEDKRKRLTDICSKRTLGQIGDDALKDDLKKFVENELKDKMLPTGLKISAGEKEYEKQKASYEAYKYYISTTSSSNIGRARGDEGISRAGILLMELFDLYIQEFDPLPEKAALLQEFSGYDGFTFSTIYHLKERAINKCSFPNCTNPTSGPVLKDSSLSRSLGKAVQIYGLRPGDKRYNPAKPQQEDDIRNAIWFCITHANLVNEFGEKDYPAEKLLKWKLMHERMMHAWVEGRVKSYLGLNSGDTNPEIASMIITHFDQQLFISDIIVLDDRPKLAASLNSIESFFEDQADRIRDYDKLLEQVYSIRLVIEIFKEETSATNDEDMFTAAYSSMQKIIGAVLAEMAADNKLILPTNINTIAPAVLPVT